MGSEYNTGPDLDQYGSCVVTGKLYSVLRGRGPLYHRQMLGNRVGCVAWAEQHHNALGVAKPAKDAPPEVWAKYHATMAKIRGQSFSMAIVDSTAKCRAESVAWGKVYTALCAAEYQQQDRGVVVYGGRGSYNVRFLRCPAILLEPLCISNPKIAASARTGDGIDGTARCLVESIRKHLPGGGLIGLSVGHAHRGKPDPGAKVHEIDVHDPKFDDETELNEAVIQHAEEMLLEILP